MLPKLIFSLDEAAQELGGLDKETIIQWAEIGAIALGIKAKHEKYIKINYEDLEEHYENRVNFSYMTYEDWKRLPEHDYLGYFDNYGVHAIHPETIKKILALESITIPSIENTKENHIKQIDIFTTLPNTSVIIGLVSWFSDRKVTIDDLVITENILQEIKDSFAGIAQENEKATPNTTQLEATIQAQQEEIERLQAEIEVLKAQITPPQTESNKTHYDCLEKVISEIEAFKDSPEFIKRGKGIQQGLIEDWLKDRTKSRDERTYLKQLITEHYGITTSRSGNPKQTPQ